MANYITDIEHMAPKGELVELPIQAWEFRDFLANIIRAATGRANLTAFTSGLRCRKKILRKACLGTISIQRQDIPTPTIDWACTDCDDGGSITGWRNHSFDLGTLPAYSPEKDEIFFSIQLTKDEFSALIDSSNIFYPDSQRILLTGERTSSGVRISAFEGDMENLVGYVAANANHPTKKKLTTPLNSAFVKIQNKLDQIFDSKDFQ